MVKSYNLTPEQVLKMSLANIEMYNAVLPQRGSGKKDKKNNGRQVISGDDIANIERIKNFGND